MLSSDEENFLNNIPSDKLVSIEPFDIRIPRITEEIIEKIHSSVPELEVKHMGASSLGISGQGDIDIYILCPKEDYLVYLPKLEKIFGPKVPSISIIKWGFAVEGHEVEMYLTDPASSSMQKQIKVFEILKDNPKLLKEYASLKESLSGKPFKEYQRQKYEFYHRILES